MNKPPFLFATGILVSTVANFHGATIPAAEDSYGYRAKLTATANKAVALLVRSGRPP